MEKYTPHTRLHVVKNMIVEQGKVEITWSATQTANKLGFTSEDIKNTILALTPKDFYKSMTTYNDTTIWQDVYQPLLPGGQVYLKLTVSNNVLVVSFKDK